MDFRRRRRSYGPCHGRAGAEADLSPVRETGVFRLMGLRSLNLIRRAARDESGASAVEFALVCIPFLALTLAAIQTSIIYFMGEALQSATQIAARQILTGQAFTNSVSQAQFKTLVCNQLPAFFKGSGSNCANLIVDVQSANSFSSLNTATITPTYDSSGNPNYTANYSIGSPGSAVIVRVMYNWPVFNLPLGFNLQDQSNNTYLLIGTAVFQNEPYVAAAS
jgi:Flp pilus assembly protein TadG